MEETKKKCILVESAYETATALEHADDKIVERESYTNDLTHQEEYDSWPRLMADLDVPMEAKDFAADGDELVASYYGDEAGFLVEEGSDSWDEFTEGKEELFLYRVHVKLKVYEKTLRPLDTEKEIAQMLKDLEPAEIEPGDFGDMIASLFR